MSILCGEVRERGAYVTEAGLRRRFVPTQGYATGTPEVLVRGRMGMGVQLTPTHARSAMDAHPVADSMGNVVSFDGRLDNFRELHALLQLDETEISDSRIVAAAFRRWGDQCFARFTGDWALALWCESQQSIFLARDHAGSRSLYFASIGQEIQWATYLDTFTAYRSDLHLSKAYAANFLSLAPIRDLAPHEEIRAVLPGYCVAVQDGIIAAASHWTPLVGTSIQYKTEDQYDDHFLSVFGTAVSRRTGSGAPILAQLSGGMDSTAIVCMSDHLRRQMDPTAPLLDTLSFFDDAEASLDERRYFLITEEKRGKTGIHIEVPFSQRSFDPPHFPTAGYPFPGRDSSSLCLERELLDVFERNGYQVLLSGIGGDEVLGGIPTGLPELSDYLVTARLLTFFGRAVAWSLPERQTLWGTIHDTVRYTGRLYTKKNPIARPVPFWLCGELHGLCTEDRQTSDPVLHRLGIAPHRVENALTWWQIMETLPHLAPQVLFRPEYRYPMLDKDLVEFLFSLPPEQLVQPGRRRAMMRRALRGIVPVEILERRRKAFQLQGPMLAIRDAASKLEQLISNSHLAEMGWIDVDEFRSALDLTVNGSAEWYQAILRTVAYELWLRERVQNTNDSLPLLTSLTVP